jgi:hypothetical protein
VFFPSTALRLLAPLLAVLLLAGPLAATDLPGFRRSPWFGEQVREEWVNDGVRVLASAAKEFDPKKPTRLIIYATPNGNSIEQTLGCEKADGVDWHFDIQHVAAQVRTLRALTPTENIVLACAEADGLSWPAWKKKRTDGPARIRRVVETIRGWLSVGEVRITLAGHSGGGSFLFGYLDGGETVPADVERFVFLDANYSYRDEDRHGDKLLAWLKAGTGRRLVVIAYDDREVMLDGKRVVGPDGGTYRATVRMRVRFEKDVALTETTADDFVHRVGLDGRLALHVHANPRGKILHTALVGEMNGLLRGLTHDWPKAAWGTFGGPRAYVKWVQPTAGIPKRPADAPGGRAVVAQLEGLKPAEREIAIADEIARGNVPDFLRTFRRLKLTAKDGKGTEHAAVLEVMPDYLAVGSDADFVRVPMTPAAAAFVADRFGCALPTRKLVDEVYRAAAVKLEPKPLTTARESVATFLAHHDLIEGQRTGKKLGELVAGVKKDVVVSNRLGEKPSRVAIYGWHQTDGQPIQPLSVVHARTYVDYSHGVRLVRRGVTVDGRERDLRHILASPDLCSLVSDEGAITAPGY